MKQNNHYWFFLSKIFFLIFILNIIVNKIILSFGLGDFVIFNDVGEFLLLFVASICFVINIVERSDKFREGS